MSVINLVELYCRGHQNSNNCTCTYSLLKSSLGDELFVISPWIPGLLRFLRIGDNNGDEIGDNLGDNIVR